MTLAILLLIISHHLYDLVRCHAKFHINQAIGLSVDFHPRMPETKMS